MNEVDARNAMPGLGRVGSNGEEMEGMGWRCAPACWMFVFCRVVCKYFEVQYVGRWWVVL